MIELRKGGGGCNCDGGSVDAVAVAKGRDDICSSGCNCDGGAGAKSDCCVNAESGGNGNVDEEEVVGFALREGMGVGSANLASDTRAPRRRPAFGSTLQLASELGTVRLYLVLCRRLVLVPVFSASASPLPR